GAGSLASGLALPEVKAASLLGKVGQGAGAGALIGGASGFGHTNDESLGQDLLATAQGAGLGTVTGGAGGAVADRVGSPVVNWIARKFSPEAAESQAVKLIADRMRKDAAGGGPTAADMLDISNAAMTKPLAIADLGGKNVQALAGQLARGPGEAGQIGTKFLTERD